MNPRISIRHVITRLVSGPLYQEDTELWNRLLLESEAVRHHYRQMGLDVVIDEDAGFAFLRQSEETDEEVPADTTGEAPLPRLLRRTPLGFHPTLLMVLLRERLLMHDQSSDGEAYLYLEQSQLIDLIRPYFPDTTDEKRMELQMTRAISRLEELAILRKIANRSETIYRVEPILRARLPVEQIREIRDRLQQHLNIEPSTDETDND